jgi:hypothetical protein
MYCIIRLRDYGEVNHIFVDDEKQALNYYYTALLYNQYEDSFIALFHRAVMIKNNQLEKEKKS